MFSDQGEGLPYVTLRRRSSHAELIEEEDNEDDDEDDGIDQVIESRRQGDSRTYSMDLDSLSSPSLSDIEHPQHAQLSPRSAASLTRMFSTERSSQSLMDSSISFELNSLSQQRTGHDYDNNPYFRRPFAPHTSISSADFQLDARTLPARRNYIQDSLFRSNGTGSSTTSTARSVSLQHETIRHDYSNYHGCGESATVASMETQGDVWPLKFDMYYADGGEFNAAHSVGNVLKNDSSVYCSRRSANINICLKLAEPHRTFVLTQFKAKAPTTGFTAPCKEGLIFISHEPILLERTAIFDDMTRERYEEYTESLKDGEAFKQLLQSHGPGADALVPAAFFQVGGPDESCTLDFTPNRSGRYVLIKLLRSRCTNSLQRPENIDLQYLGLIGKRINEFCTKR
ncbi:hypothetical protein BGZ58_011170 [Dissophora ornata]|nr:hypothetical protein BGZ58_011170 [Dissophora ornata]